MSDSRHPLADWLEQRRMSQVDFAEKAGISESHLSLVLQRQRGLSAGQMLKIAKATAGAISVEALAHEQANVQREPVQ